MTILYIFLVLSYCYAVLYKTLRNVHMLQQNLYNENNRYLKWVFKNSFSLSSCFGMMVLPIYELSCGICISIL